MSTVGLIRTRIDDVEECWMVQIVGLCVCFPEGCKERERSASEEVFGIKQIINSLLFFFFYGKKTLIKKFIYNFFLST